MGPGGQARRHSHGCLQGSALRARQRRSPFLPLSSLRCAAEHCTIPPHRTAPPPLRGRAEARAAPRGRGAPPPRNTRAYPEWSGKFGHRTAVLTPLNPGSSDGSRGVLQRFPSTTNLDEELRGSLPRLAARPPQVSPTVVHSAQRVHGGPRFAAPSAQPPAGRAV